MAKRGELAPVEYEPGVWIRPPRPYERREDYPKGGRLYRVRQGDMLDHISFRTYGDERYWYLIADVNDITDPTEPLVPDTILFIPNL